MSRLGALVDRRERPAFVAFVGLLALLAFAAPTFFSPSNLRDLIIANALTQIIAVGMTLVILTGHVDVSVGATAGLCGVTAAALARGGLPAPFAALAAVGVGALIGTANGMLVTRLRLPAIVVTLAVLVIVRDGLRWATDGAWMTTLGPDFQWFGLDQAWGQALIFAAALGTIVGGVFVLRSTAIGRAVLATGSDAESARLVGLRPDRVVTLCFVVCGALTGLGAALNASRFAEVPGTVTAGLEMKVIASVVVGGTSITGGRGSIVGTVLGVALLGTIGTGLTFLGVNAYWERALQGAIILVAILYESLRRQPVRTRPNPTQPDRTRPNLSQPDPTRPPLIRPVRSGIRG